MDILVPEPTWEQRDLPVLRAAVELIERAGRPVEPGGVSLHLMMEINATQKALEALANANPPFFNEVHRGANESIWFVHRPTDRARQAIGLWPTPESLADRLVLALAQAAERETDVERRGWLKRTAEWLGSAGRDVAVDVTAAVISRQVGGA